MRSMEKSWYQSLIKSATGQILCFWSGTKIIVIEANGYPGWAVCDPSTGEVRSDEPDNIACWFFDSCRCRSGASAAGRPSPGSLAASRSGRWLWQLSIDFEVLAPEMVHRVVI